MGNGCNNQTVLNPENISSHSEDSIIHNDPYPNSIQGKVQPPIEDHAQVQAEAQEEIKNLKPKAKYYEMLESKLKNNLDIKDEKNSNGSFTKTNTKKTKEKLEQKEQKEQKEESHILMKINEMNEMNELIEMNEMNKMKEEEDEYLKFGFLRNIGGRNRRIMHLEFLAKTEKDKLKYQKVKKKIKIVGGRNPNNQNSNHKFSELKIDCENINKESSSNIKYAPKQNTPIITINKNKFINSSLASAPSKTKREILQCQTYEMMKSSFHNPNSNSNSNPNQGLNLNFNCNQSVAQPIEHMQNLQNSQNLQKLNLKMNPQLSNGRNMDIFGNGNGNGNTQDPQGESEVLKSQKTGYFKSIQSSIISEESKNEADEHSSRNRNRNINIDNKFQAMTTVEVETQALSSNFQQRQENPQLIYQSINELEKQKSLADENKNKNKNIFNMNNIKNLKNIILISPEEKKEENKHKNINSNINENENQNSVKLLGSIFQIQKGSFQKRNLLKLGKSTGTHRAQNNINISNNNANNNNNVNKESIINDNAKLIKNIKSFKSRGSLDFENISIIESNSKNVIDFPLPRDVKQKEKEQKHEDSFESDLSAYNSNPKDSKKEDISASNLIQLMKRESAISIDNLSFSHSKLQNSSFINKIKEQDKMNKSGFRFIENLPDGFLATMPLFNSMPVTFRKISKFNTNQNLDEIPNKMAAILKKINHPNIEKYFYFINDDNLRHNYTIKEINSKNNLINKLKQKDLTRTEMKSYFCQIVDAIDYIHQMGLIYGNLCPQNISIDENNNVKLCNFNYNISQAPNSISSYHFLAPEICKGVSFKGQQSDIWSLGVVLYFLNYKMLPFIGSVSYDLINNILTKKPHFSEGIDALLRDLIEKMLEKDRIKRITIDQIKEHKWINGLILIKKKYTKIKITQEEEDKSYISLKELCALSKIKLHLLPKFKKALQRHARMKGNNDKLKLLPNKI